MRELDLTTRPGTGVYAKGQQRILEILRAARDVLINEGYHQLTMRKVAKRCGITVGNLNYYYPSKADLLKDLLDRVVDGYMLEFERIRGEHNTSPLLQFEAIIRFLMEDLASPETTVFFPELWALANHDAYSAERMDDIYESARSVFNDLIPQINPGLSEAETAQVALFISASIEGHTMFIGDGKAWNQQREAIINIAVRSLTQLVTEIKPDHIASP